MTDSFSPAGMGLLLFVPSVRDVHSPTLAELAAGVDLTYSLRSFEPSVSNLGLSMWSGPWTVQYIDSVQVEWPYSRTDPSVAQQTLTPGVRGVLAWRLGYPHDAPVVVGSVFNSIIPFRAGFPQDSPLSGVATKVQRLDVTGVCGQEVTVS